MSDTPYDLPKAVSEASQAVGKVSESTNKFLDLVKPFFAPKLKLRQAEADAVYVRTQADAEAYAVLRHAQAEVAANELKAQAAFRLTQTWVRQQENINATVEEAQKYLPSETPTDDVDPDWVTRFFEGCQDITDPQMRTLFAKILAGEFAKPGTISRKTISLLRDMSANDADLFRVAATYFWFIGGVNIDGFVPQFTVYQDQWVLSYGQLVDLEEMGLLSRVATSISIKNGVTLVCGAKKFRAVSDGNDDLSVYMLTTPARELFAVSGFQEPPQHYIEASLLEFADPATEIKAEAIVD